MKLSKIVLVCVFIITIMSVSFAANYYSDIRNTEYWEAVKELDSLYVISPYPDGEFKPDSKITRAEAAKLFAVCMRLEDVESENVKVDYVDVPSIYWAYYYIETMADYLPGFDDGTYRPDANITAAEFVAACIRCLGYKNVVEAQGTYPTAYILKANELNLLSDTEDIRFSEEITRRNACIILWNMLNTKMWRVTSSTNSVSSKTMLEVKFPEKYEEINSNQDSNIQIEEKLDIFPNGEIKAVKEGYTLDDLEPKQVVIENLANNKIKIIDVQPTNKSHFEIIGNTQFEIRANGGYGLLKLRPKVGLPVGTYETNLIVTVESGNTYKSLASRKATFKVLKNEENDSNAIIETAYVSSYDELLENALNPNVKKVVLSNNINYIYKKNDENFKFVVEDQNRTLDLCGYTFLSNIDVRIDFFKDKKLTIMDSSSKKTGTIKNSANISTISVYAHNTDCELVINGGNFIRTISSSYPSIMLRDLSYPSKYECTLEIESGNFKSETLYTSDFSDTDVIIENMKLTPSEANLSCSITDDSNVKLSEVISNNKSLICDEIRENDIGKRLVDIVGTKEITIGDYVKEEIETIEEKLDISIKGQFKDLNEGYRTGEIEFKQILIKNLANNRIGILRVEVTNKEHFEIVGRTTFEISANSTNGVLMLRPKKDLGIGTYETGIIITFESGNKYETPENRKITFNVIKNESDNINEEIKEIEKEEINSKNWNNPFVDVTNNDWYYDAVKYVTEEGICNGISENSFGTTQNVTRGMLITMLYRSSNVKITNTKTDFEDVSDSAYYAAPVAWAHENKLVNGITDKEYAPDNEITREQLVVVLYRYAQYKGKAEDVTYQIEGYTDSYEISSYAEEAFEWAIYNKLISGRTTETLAPKGTATRVEVATMLMRFSEKF